jgi:hypothetical protein
MDAEAIKHLGGLCQLLGVVVVVWDLWELTRYRRVLDQVAAWLRSRWVTSWLRGRWARVVAWVRKKLGRPGRSVTLQVQAVSSTSTAGQVTLNTFPGPFAVQPGQSAESQLWALALMVNRLREEIMREPQERDRAITQAREQLQGELRTEAGRLQAASDALRGQFEELREVTTGGVRLRWEGVPPLLLGIVFTTWPDGVADVLPDWPPLRVVVSFIGAYILARFSWAWWQRHGQHWPGESGPRVGMAVPWHGPPRQPPQTG